MHTNTHTHTHTQVSLQLKIWLVSTLKCVCSNSLPYLFLLSVVCVLGENFLTSTSELLCFRGGPKLAVGGACTSVAVDLGDLEGRGPDILERWEQRHKELTELLDWQSFKQASDQVLSVCTSRG